MIRGTTPKHIFSIPFSTDLIKELKVIYSQSGKAVLSKYKADCTLKDSEISLTLTQEDTFKFDCLKGVEIQVRILTVNDEALASKIETVEVEKCLDNEVL